MMFLRGVAYSWCGLLLFSCSSRLHSQIVYTDIPDATPDATYPLDLNNDNLVDFLIQFEGADKVMCKPENSNAYAGNFAGGMYFPWALSEADVICDALVTWYDAGNPGIMAWGTGIGNWAGVTDRYLALKLVVGTNTYYGWARLDLVPASTSFTIKDYAYGSTPDACIQAGQTALGVGEVVNRNVLSVFPNPLISLTTIQATGNMEHADLTIVNSHGQTARQVCNISGQTVSLGRDNLPAGLYFILLAKEGEIIAVEKLLIAD